MSRHLAAHDRVATFVRAWRRAFPQRAEITDGFGAYPDLLLTDLETLLKPRIVVRTLVHLQALAVGTIIVVQGNRAAQVESNYDFDFNEDGVITEGKRLLYVGVDLYDNLLPDPSKEERDTLRRMLPAIVIDPLD